MANLKWKTPRSKTRSRRAANWKLNPRHDRRVPAVPSVAPAAFRLRNCGFYNGRQVVTPKDEHAGHNHG